MNPLWHPSPPVPRRERPPTPVRASTSAPALYRIKSALESIPNETDPLDYDTWRNVLFAIHAGTEGSDEGLALAHEFSSRSGKYDPDFIDNRFWPYAGARADDTLPVEYLFSLAERNYGWQDPTIVDDFESIDPPEKEKKDKPKFTFVQAAEFSAGKPMGWIIKNVIPAAELVVMYGESTAGKTFMVLDMVASISRGADWRDHKTTQGLRCGYIVAEGASGFRLRLQAYARHHSVNLKNLELAVLANAPNFLEKEDIHELVYSMRDYGKFDLLVVDTLAQSIPGGNENSGEDMGRAITHCKTLRAVTGATVLLIHHSGKDASRGARGWSGLRAAADAELEVCRAGADRVLTISKMKDGPGEGVQFGFRLLDVPLGMDDDGEVYGSCVVDHCDASPIMGRNGPKGKHEQHIYKAVLDLLDEGGGCPSREEVLESYLARVPLDPLAKRDTRRQHADRALRGLIDRGMLTDNNLRIGLPDVQPTE